MHPVMMCQHRSRGIDDGAGPHPDAGTQESLGITGRDEADVVAVGFVGHRQPAPGGFGTNLWLRGVAHRECSVTQLRCGQHGKHVGLILIGVDGPAQPALREPGVMAGGHRIETQRQRLGGQSGELDPLVTADARVRSLAARIGVDEVLDHVVLESVGEIPDIEGDSENVGDTARIGGILLGAASARSGSQRAGCLRQR